ncbi:MAG TPA: HU family DNA-binding protein [Actinomycetota bacterium]
MNKTDLVHELVSRTDLERKDVARVVNAMLDVVRTTVAKGGRVTLADFGTFERVRRAARVGRNPHTGEAVRIPATVKPTFRPGRGFLKAAAPRRRKATRKVTRRR